MNAFAAECTTWRASWWSETYANNGLVEQGRWVDRALDEGATNLRFYAQQGANINTCMVGRQATLGWSAALRYQGHVDVLKLSMSDASWRNLVPDGEFDIQGRAERWRWAYVGMPLSFESANRKVAWRLTPKLIALQDYSAKNLDLKLRRDGQAISLDGSYFHSAKTSLGYFQSPQAIETTPGVSVDLAWSYDLPSGQQLALTVENLWSRTQVRGQWSSDTHLQLSMPLALASTENITASNEVTGTYGQIAQTLALPRTVRVTYRPASDWVDELDVLNVSQQWHWVAEKSWPLGPGQMNVRLQDLSTAWFGYTWDLPFGHEHQLRWAWGWSKWGMSAPAILSWQMRF